MMYSKNNLGCFILISYLVCYYRLPLPHRYLCHPLWIYNAN